LIGKLIDFLKLDTSVQRLILRLKSFRALEALCEKFPYFLQVIAHSSREKCRFYRNLIGRAVEKILGLTLIKNFVLELLLVNETVYNFVEIGPSSSTMVSSQRLKHTEETDLVAGCGLSVHHILVL
jgi:hypothetical protein